MSADRPTPEEVSSYLPPRRDVISAAVELEAKSAEYHRLSTTTGGPAEARRARALWRVAAWLRKQVSDGK